MATSRYKSMRTLVDSKNRILYETFPKIDNSKLQHPDDFIVQIKDGERLDSLAEKYLGDGRYWWVICVVNNISFPFGEDVSAGTIIRIPNKLDRVFQHLDRK